MEKREICAITLTAIVLVGALLASPVASQGSAHSAISSAKSTIAQCYDAMQQAESAGANVDSLITKLNEAAGSLSNAELAYSSGDYATAYSAASQCQSQLGDFISQANTLQQSAEATRTQNFVFNVLSLTFSVSILCTGIAAWIILNKRERRTINGTPKI
jgi:ABC-type transport system involved in multi-copper enzyme maturation permease subunit